MAKQAVVDIGSPKKGTTDNSWTLRLGYDPRFCTVGLQLSREGVEGDTASFYLTLPHMIEQLHIPPHELRALLMPEYEWTEEGMVDIDPARERLLDETDWKGKVVLDIGGYDGFAAHAAYKMGAKRAICLDNHQYEHYGWKDIKKEGVEYITGDVMHWTEQVDTIINYNVLYHMKNPWAFLDKCRELIKEDGEMILCTLFRYHDGAWMYLYEPRECNKTDISVYFGPSIIALERLLKATGWTAKQYALAYDRVLYRCKPTPGFEPHPWSS